MESLTSRRSLRSYEASALFRQLSAPLQLLGSRRASRRPDSAHLLRPLCLQPPDSGPQSSLSTTEGASLSPTEGAKGASRAESTS